VFRAIRILIQKPNLAKILGGWFARSWSRCIMTFGGKEINFEVTDKAEFDRRGKYISKAQFGRLVLTRH